jgi:carbamate kinase
MTPDLLVVALGGNALSPPAGDPSIAAERARIRESASELARLASAGRRLLVVHGNGPQVGRLLARGAADEQLDVAVAQTQGELGYLVSEALCDVGAGAAVAMMTRVLVDAADSAFRHPDKPVGPVLDEHPTGHPARPTPDGRGWRRVVASPRPRAVIEVDAVRALLDRHHVVAGGGGGIPLTTSDGRRAPCPAVVDKDWVASLLAVALGAAGLLYVTDVPQAFDHFASPTPVPIPRMPALDARRRLERGVFAPGSMAPKVGSALEYVEATGRPAVIAGIGGLAAALRGTGGTTVVP